MIDLIQSRTRDAVALALDGLQQRHIALTANMVNADTPNYKAIDVDFESQLKSFLGKDSDPDALPLLTSSGSIGAYQTSGSANSQTNAQSNFVQAQTSYRADNNSVDVDKEMTRMGQTAERYLALSQMESKLFKSVRSVITGTTP